MVIEDLTLDRGVEQRAAKIKRVQYARPIVRHCGMLQSIGKDGDNRTFFREVWLSLFHFN